MKQCLGRIPITRMSGFKTLILILGMVAFVNLPVLPQKKDDRGEKMKQSTYAAIQEAPAKERERKNPFDGDTQAMAVGRKLFEQHCAECHGQKAEGTRKGPTLLRDEVKQAPPGALFWILTNGVVRQGMPVWSKLPEQQRWQLVTFVRSLNAPPAP